MIKKTAFLLFSCTVFLNTNSMFKQYNHVGVKKLKHPTHSTQNDLIKVRETLQNIAKIACFTENPATNTERETFINELVREGCLYSVRKPTIEEDEYDCAGYANSQVLGLKRDIAIPLESMKVKALDTFKYFKQTNNPKKNDLIIYCSSPSVAVTSHVGIVIGEDEIESKWGLSMIIANHKKSNLPSSYGDYFRFYTLKNKFRILPRNLLLNLMEYDAQANDYKFQRKLNNGLLKYYSSIASSDIATAKKLICMPLSTLELLQKG